MIVGGVRLPRRKSQSGRRLFVLPATVAGNELWLDSTAASGDGFCGRTVRRKSLIAVAAAAPWPVKDAFYQGRVPEEERQKIRLADIGTYELIDGSLKASDGYLVHRADAGRRMEAGEGRKEIAAHFLVLFARAVNVQSQLAMDLRL